MIRYFRRSLLPSLAAQGKRRTRCESVFERLEPRLVLDSTVVFNELMYNPAGDTDDTLEWVELFNQLSVDMDLSGWTLDGAVDFPFPEGTTIAGRSYLVVATNPEVLETASGYVGAMGPFSGNLSNGGETLRLLNNNGRIMNEISYGDDDPWHVGPDGGGPSLAKIDELTGSEDPDHWSFSLEAGGTPGDVNFPSVTDVTVIPPFTQSLIDDGSSVRVLIPTQAGDLTYGGRNWNETEFDDASAPGWFDANTGVGYDTTGTSLVGPFIDANGDIQAEMFNQNGSGFTRIPFQVNDPNAYEQLDLEINYNDGYVAYLNGTEIARQNAPVGTPAFDATTSETPSGYVSAVLADAPVGYYRFEEGTVSGTAADIAPAQGINNGTYVGFNSGQVITGPLTGESSNFAIHSDDAFDYVRVNDSFSGGALAATEFTIELWAKRDSTSTAAANLFVRGNFFATGSQFMQQNGSQLNSGFNNGNSLSTLFPGAVGEWVHLASTYTVSGGTTTIRTYANGSLVATDSSSGAPANNSGQFMAIGTLPFNIGGDPFSTLIQGFDGGIDEVAYYDKALSQAQIQAHYDASTGMSGGVGLDMIDLDNQLDLLITGENVLAIQGFNTTAGDSDFLVRAQLDALIPEAIVSPTDPSPLVINEIASAIDEQFRVEIKNTGNSSIDLDGYVLTATGGTGGQYTFPAQTLSPGGFFDVSETALGFSPSSGEKLFFYAPGQNELISARVVDNVLRGRSESHDGQWLYPDSPTPGATNSFSFEDQVVINEVMYHDRGVQEVPAEVERIPLVQVNSTWKYNQTGANLGTSWREPSYNDTLWPSGAAALVRDDFPFLPVGVKTTLSTGPTTYYFRHKFQWSGDTSVDAIWLRPLLDDGAVFYVNGVEVHRANMPAGTISYNTTAASSVDYARWLDVVAIPTSAFVVGENTIAVEVHQSSTSDSDVAFAMALYSTKTLTTGTPFIPSDEEWIELFNRGATPVDLSGWSLEDAVAYDFPAGTTLNPGEYLVVARDEAALAANYPAINIVGQYTGGLSNDNERILLLDAANNPADEVHYYEGGRWPALADGGGSSLELRDPDADNSRAEAWAASDETDQSTWNTYSFRQIASYGTGPNLWYEFWMGLLDAGELLIDDIQWIADPDGAAANLMQNGTFEGDTLGSSPTKWRMTGHQLGTVIADPDMPGNKVLHFVATGTMAQLNNHAETTTVGNTGIVNGTEYEISFRAKWLGGSNQLNTRIVSNRVASTHLLDVPANTGTPGAANSTVEANIGPTYSDFRHSPVLPAAHEAVTVSVGVADPDNVASMTVWWSVNSGTWQSAPMTLGAGGTYRGTIPGQSGGTIVQFYVEGQDGLGAVSTYPAAGQDSRALYKVNDNVGHSAIDTLRLIMTPADNSNMLVNTNIFNNSLIGSTLIVNNSEVFYDVGARLKGSVSSRPVVPGSFRVRLHPDNKFRDVHDSISIDRIKPVEMIIKQLFNHLGGPVSIYDDLAYSISAPYTGIVTLQLARYDDVWASETFANGGDGTLFEYEVVYNQTDTTGGVEGLKRAAGFDFYNGDIVDLGDRKENYRWQYQIKNQRERDDYSQIVKMAKAFSLTGTALDEATQQVLDVDQWLQTFAMVSLSGNGDVYSAGFGPHNVHLFVRPSDKKILVMPHDQEAAYSFDPSNELYDKDFNLAKLIELPANLRLYYGHMQDIMNTTFNSTYISPWATHYGLLAGSYYGNITNYIQSRNDFVSSQLALLAPPVAFAVTTNNPMVASDATTTVMGNGGIDVREIRLDGVPIELDWSVGAGASYAQTWQATIPVQFGTNSYTFEAYDFQGNPIGTQAINITSSVGNPVVDSLRITEINYHPTEPTIAELSTNPALDNDDFEFVQVENVGAQSIQLLGVSFGNGVTFDFPSSSLAPGARGVVVRDQTAFELRYGMGLNVLGEFTSGGLNNAGERVSLVVGGNAFLDFEYGDDAPWPEGADGRGQTLQLIDPANTPVQDYGDFASWRGSTQPGGTPAAPPVGPVGIVIHEVLAHSDLPQVDSIELLNTTGSSIDIGGWWLSDDAGNFFKFQIPDPTVIPAGGFVVFDESHFNPNPGSPGPNDFALSSYNGDQVWLIDPNGTNSAPELFVDNVVFGATLSGETLGRWPNSDGRLDPLITATLGAANSAPRVGPVIISEIMYNPPGQPGSGVGSSNLEFVEIYNPTAKEEDLSNWQLNGIAFDFLPGTTIGPGQVVVVVPFDPVSDTDEIAHFESTYRVSLTQDPAQYVGPYTGRLDGNGERLSLLRADHPPVGMPTLIPLVIEERVDYNDTSPWPTSADGAGDSLHRTASDLWAGDATNWQANQPSPGVLGPLVSPDYIPSTKVIGEIGQITTLTHVTHTVPLSKTYSNPVVIAQPLSYFGSQEAVVRIDNVQAGQFDMYVTEPSNLNGLHGVGEVVSYIVLEAGVHTLPGGARVEAGTVATNATVGRNVTSSSWETVSLNASLETTPVVVSQPQTANGVPFLTTRHDAIGTNSFQVALEQEEAITTAHATETVGYLVIEPGADDWGAIAYEAQTSATVYTDVATSLSFLQPFATAPLWLGSLATRTGGDNAHLRYQHLTANSVEIIVEEDTTTDTELVHSAEEAVGYLAFAEAGQLEALTTSLPDNQTQDFSVNVPETGTVIDVDVTLSIWHNRVDDLDVFLESPGGTIVELLTDVGGTSQDLYSTTLDDEAAVLISAAATPLVGSFQPEGTLADFDGQAAAGTWRLQVTDDTVNGDEGILVDWSLDLQLAPAPDGNLNQDSASNATDIDLLYANLGGQDPTFDLDHDGHVDSADVDELVHQILGKQFGDADLDQDVDVRDFSQLVANFDPLGSGAPKWSQGNFNGDDKIDILDFNLLASYYAPLGYAPPSSMQSTKSPETMSLAWNPTVPTEALTGDSATQSFASVTSQTAMGPDSRQESHPPQQDHAATDLAFSDRELGSASGRRRRDFTIS